jgi:hypothetical protein
MTTGVKRDAGKLYRQMDTGGLEGAALRDEIKYGIKEVKAHQEINNLMREFISMESDPIVVSKIVEGSRLKRTADGLFEVYVNAILYGPPTHAINMASNTALLFWNPTERIIEGMGAAAVGDFWHAKDQFEEGTARLIGVAQGFRDFMRIMSRQETWDSLKLDGGHFASGEIARMRLKPSLTKENFELYGHVGGAFDVIGQAIRLSGYMLQKEDQFFKLGHYRADLNAQALKMARNDGGDAVQMWSTFETLRHNPTAQMSRAAIEEGEYNTFTNELGDASSTLHKWIKKFPTGRFWIPFFATPTNIVKMGVKRGITGQTLDDQKYKIFKPLKEALTDWDGPRGHAARARLAMGPMLVGSIIWQLDDSKINGYKDASTPAGRLDIEKNGPGYAWKSSETGEWISFEGVEPMRSILGYYIGWKKAFQAIDYDGAVGELKADPWTGLTNLGEEMLMAAITPMMQTMGENYMMQQMSQINNFLEAMSRDPQIKSGEPRGAEYAYKIFQKMAISSVPASNLGRQINNQVIDGHFRMANTWLEQIKQIIPGMSLTLKPRLTVWGDIQEYEDGVGPDLISPLKTTKVEFDYYDRVISELKVPVPGTPREITYGDPSVLVPLTTDQQYRFQEIRAFGPNGLTNLKDTFKELIDGPGFLQLAPEEQQAVLQARFSEATKFARDALVGEDKELSKLIAQHQAAQLEHLQSGRNGGRHEPSNYRLRVE